MNQEAQLLSVISAAYDSAVAPERWPGLLGQLGTLFRSHFVDAFARSDDYTRYGGICHGLDLGDYEGVFLGTWVARNVWGKRHPVRRAGEVLSTRQMLTRDELVRTDMYNDYLAPRGLHEGLRLSISAGHGWIQDMSLLRPWSAGAFEDGEFALAHAVLPHLQRATAVTRRLQDAESLGTVGLAALDRLRHPAFVLDGDGRLLRMNTAGQGLLAQADGLWFGPAGLHAATPSASAQLDRVLGQASGRTRAGRQHAASGHLRLPCPSGRRPLNLLALPLAADSCWPGLHGPAVLVVVDDPAGPALQTTGELAARFGLTAMEASLALDLRAGNSLAEVARTSGRSVNTVRTHLARLMAKTGTTRQAALVSLLLEPSPQTRPGSQAAFNKRRPPAIIE